tara:strand:- start:821 stop:1573 length:753 start_codon:yes stop_codon:yes gene_type:complete
MNMNIWDGEYKTFDVALKKSKGKGFNGIKWKESQLRDFKICKKFYLKKKKLPLKISYRYKNFGNIIKKYFPKKKNIRILDFGGGFGLGFYYLKQNIGFDKIDYTIVESKQIVGKFKNLNKKINYKTNLRKDEFFEIVNFCSVLQYIQDWRKFIINISKRKIKYIYLSDMFVGNIKSFVSLQNYYKSKIPHWFINFDELNNLLNSLDYILIQKKKMITKRLNKKTILQMNNFSKKNRIKYTLNLLYKKRYS